MTPEELNAEKVRDLTTRHPAWDIRDVFAVLKGEMTESDILERRALDFADDRLSRMARASWPCPAIVWDLDPQRFYRAMDGQTPEAFAEHFGAIDQIWVEVEALHAALAKNAKRNSDPYARPYLSKTRRLIAHLAGGGQVSPPLLHVDARLDGLALAGGYHRMNWARYVKAGTIPVLLREAHREAVLRRITPASPSGVSGTAGSNEDGVDPAGG